MCVLCKDTAKKKKSAALHTRHTYMHFLLLAFVQEWTSASSESMRTPTPHALYFGCTTVPGFILSVKREHVCANTEPCNEPCDEICRTCDTTSQTNLYWSVVSGNQKKKERTTAGTKGIGVGGIHESFCASKESREAGRMPRIQLCPMSRLHRPNQTSVFVRRHMGLYGVMTGPSSRHDGRRDVRSHRNKKTDDANPPVT